ncbi:MAG: tRNA (adenosine(37)-N6)-threonylcarbamoyltransferase complex transferase subunit TsaD [Actinomycetota bacterium]|nr:MAG: O-sialoglycoprotein [Actinomycetota bacterium]MDO8949054.1 tRNA (adenosine(37)-N6)-threonylcarbamoyltransferase complex transferase subunit TsaD [Actinomycetota bacterium]MDP3630603.1 tRNA (adenosine(37)-N6)-threonylcarbamoyltransferase complex transferase subunit TsaD [Actinomycetota bacterium]
MSAIRRMTPEDLNAVLGIEAASFGAPWTRALFEDELARENDRVWLVAGDDDALVGFGGIMLAPDGAHIMDLAVTPEARRLGVARGLMLHLAREAADRGVARMTLEVGAGNTAALALYASLGFTATGLRPRYYDDTGEDAVIMWADTARPAAILAAERGEDLVLAIESSCDETAASVMRGGTEILSSVVATQVDFHARFGGVVPEIASRKHTEAIVGVIDEALERAGVTLVDLDALAITYGPGLIGALVVGVAYAKGLALGTGLPLVGVNHLEGHIFASKLADPELEPPLIALVVSGGHTSLVHVPAWGEYHTLGSTLDDAAGEAFDKVAKLVGIGYPGGPAISRLAEQGNPAAIPFPRAMLHSGDYDFSLSGLKTAVITYVRKEEAAGRTIHLPDLAASFQAAVIDVQVAKAVRAATEYDVRHFCLGGGVAANTALREALRSALADNGVRLSVPPFSLCTDNAAMIAAAAHFRLTRGAFLELNAEATASLPLGV